jgi:hypothetical protein
MPKAPKNVATAVPRSERIANAITAPEIYRPGGRSSFCRVRRRRSRGDRIRRGKLVRGDYRRGASDRHTSKYSRSRSVSGMGRRYGRRCSGNASGRVGFRIELGN